MPKQNNHMIPRGIEKTIHLKQQKIDEFSKTLLENLTGKELVSRGFYLSMASLTREFRARINCPTHSKNEKGEFVCTRENLINWLKNVLAETGMLHYSKPEKMLKPNAPKWVQLEFEW